MELLQAFTDHSPAVMFLRVLGRTDAGLFPAPQALACAANDEN